MKERRVSCFRRAWNCLLDVLLCRGNLEKSPEYLAEEETQPVSFNELFRYASLKDRLFILFGCLSAAVGGAAQPMIFVVDGLILSTYLAHEKQRSTLFHDVRIFLIYCGIIGIIQMVATFFQTWFLQRASCNLVKRLRRNFISSMLKEKDLSSVNPWICSEGNSKLNINIEIIEEAVTKRLGAFTRAISLLITAVAVCFRINWKISLTALAMGPVTAWTLGIVGLVLKPFITKIEGASESADYVLEESIMNLRTVVACNAQDHMEKKLTKIINSSSRTTRRYNFWLGFFNGLTLLESHAIAGVTFVAGIYGFYHGWVKRGGDVILIVNVMALTGYYLSQLGQHFHAILRARVAISSVYELLDTKSFSPVVEEIPLKDVEGKIELDNVTLKDPETDKIILKDVSMDILPGQTVAFVGLNAVGKDVIDLLVRQISPNCGQIKVDGLSLEKMDVHSLRQVIGIVDQVPKLFNGTILENIVLGRKGISSEEAKLAAKIARADEFITKFPKDYRTVFGVGGVALSVGQKQRIAIARALANDPKIFILDEPTANLDAENEKIIQIILNQMAKERTSILITQQVCSLKEVDRIYLFENGEVIESGNYLELIEMGKSFARMVKIEELQNQEDVEKALPSLAAKRNRTMKKNKKSVSFDKDLPEEKEDHIETKEKGTNGLSFLYLNLAGNYIKLALAGTFIIFRGLELPLIGVQLSLVFKTFLSENKDRYMEMSQNILTLCLICGLICLISTTGIYYFTGLTTDKMLSKLKIAAFRSLLNRPFTSFDKPQSSPTVCLNKLKNHVPNCAFAFDHHMAITLVNLTGVIVGLAMAFFFRWEMGLLGYGLCFIQFMITVLNIKMSNETRKRREEEDFSKPYQAEIVEHSKDIQTLTAEHFFKKRYLLELHYSTELVKEASFIHSVNIALAASFFSFSAVLSHCLNTYLVVKAKLPLETIIFAYLGTVVAAMSVMQMAPYLPNIFLARTSARQLSKLIDDEDDIHTMIFRGDKPDIVGEVTLTHVDFAHPSRPDIKIARELSLAIKNGENVALVGVPGSGKSAIIPLLERFYIADWGQILIDKSNVRNMNIRHLHSNVALVPKDPVLFKGTILENLTMGADGISMKKVTNACKQANAIKFIESFPQGYETNVGENGSRLTNSQKQRLAIARALIKQSKIIIFEQPRETDDEESLQKAWTDSRLEKTSITIARKISSVQSCDRIFVIHKGTVVESGTPEELLQLRGRFSRLLEAENL